MFKFDGNAARSGDRPTKLGPAACGDFMLAGWLSIIASTFNQQVCSN